MVLDKPVASVDYFEGNEQERNPTEEVDLSVKPIANMEESPVSFVLGDPDPNEEQETEDSFPSHTNDMMQQQPVLPGLVERRKRLR